MGKTDLRRENIIVFIAKSYSGTEGQNIKKTPKNPQKQANKTKQKQVTNKKPIKLLPLPHICLHRSQLWSFQLSFSIWYFWLLSLPLAAWSTEGNDQYVTVPLCWSFLILFPWFSMQSLPWDTIFQDKTASVWTFHRLKIFQEIPSCSTMESFMACSMDSAPLCGLQGSTYSAICSTFSTSFSDLFVHHSTLNSTYPQ